MAEKRSHGVFQAADYAVFVIMLLMSGVIGVYFAYKDRKSKAGVQGYLMGGRQLNHWPVAVSLSLSFVSAVTILGIPAEIYIFGSMYCWLLLCIFVCVPPVTEIFIPIFYRLGITSSFEYLQLRFNYTVRLFATGAYIIQNIMYIGIMIFAPSVALTSVTNLNLWVAIFSIGLVCTFYTTLGGLKAVIWTDVFQALVVILGASTTLFVCASKAGGWERIWRLNRESGRIDFGNFETDVRIRHTFWSVTIGLGFLWMSVFGTSQSQVQRYLCCKTERNAKKAILFSMVISSGIFILSVLTGFVMYAYFKSCDPLLNREISAPDQLLPYMVLDAFREHPGLPGLFVAGVFASCLSTVSSGINAMALVTVEDFLRPFVKWSEKTLTWWSRGLVLLYGLLCIGFACISTLLGGVLQASLSVIGIVGGPLLGVFSLGIVFPCGNSIGAISGLITGITMTTWIYVGSQQYPPLLEYTRPKLRHVDNCENSPFSSPVEHDRATRPDIAINFYAVSYAYYTAIGYATTLGIGLIFSLLSRGHQSTQEVNPRLIRPLFEHKLLKWLPLRFRQFMLCGIQHDHVDKHEVLTIPTPTSNLKRRLSSRERMNSLRHSRHYWRSENVDENKEKNNENLKVSNTKEELLPTHTRAYNVQHSQKIGQASRYDKTNDAVQSNNTKKSRKLSKNIRSMSVKSSASSKHALEVDKQDVESGVPSFWL